LGGQKYTKYDKIYSNSENLWRGQDSCLGVGAKPSSFSCGPGKMEKHC